MKNENKNRQATRKNKTPELFNKLAKNLEQTIQIPRIFRSNIYKPIKIRLNSDNGSQLLRGLLGEFSKRNVEELAQEYQK